MDNDEDELFYLAASTNIREDEHALRHLSHQDSELDFARERLALFNEENKARALEEDDLMQQFGQLLAQHFTSQCRKCEEPMAFYLDPPFEKWTCDFCGHGFTEETYACSVTPEECDTTWCTKCFRKRHKVKERTPEPTPEPTPTLEPEVVPEPTPPMKPKPKPKRVKKAVKKAEPEGLPHSVVLLLDADETSCRLRLEGTMRDSVQCLLQMFGELTREAQRKDLHKVSAVDVKKTINATDEGWNMSKANMQTAAYSTVQSEEEMREFAQKIETWYHEKPGDVVTELTENLRYPTSVETLDVLSAISNALLEKDEVVAEFGGVLAELLVLRQYTQKPLDLDRDVTWEGVPSESRLQYEYEMRYSDWNWENEDKRNGSIFGPICSALRDQGPGGTQSEWSESVLRRWIKWVCTVGAICSQPGKEVDTVWRGLGGGCLPGFVVENHRTMTGLLGWPALSSTSFDRDASYSYMMGTAANSVSQPNAANPGTIMFKISSVRTGKVLQALSQYPEEAELLLGPFNLFRIDSIEPDLQNPFRNESGEPMGLLVSCTSMGPVDMAQFHHEVRTDAVKASKRLQSDNNEQRLTILRELATALHADLGTQTETELLSHCHDLQSYVQLLTNVVHSSPVANPTPAIKEKSEGDYCRELNMQLHRGGVALPQGGYTNLSDAAYGITEEMALLKSKLHETQKELGVVQRKSQSPRTSMTSLPIHTPGASVPELFQVNSEGELTLLMRRVRESITLQRSPLQVKLRKYYELGLLTEQEFRECLAHGGVAPEPTDAELRRQILKVLALEQKQSLCREMSAERERASQPRETPQPQTALSPEELRSMRAQYDGIPDSVLEAIKRCGIDEKDPSLLLDREASPRQLLQAVIENLQQQVQSGTQNTQPPVEPPRAQPTMPTPLQTRPVPSPQPRPQPQQQPQPQPQPQTQTQLRPQLLPQQHQMRSHSVQTPQLSHTRSHTQGSPYRTPDVYAQQSADESLLRNQILQQQRTTATMQQQMQQLVQMQQSQLLQQQQQQAEKRSQIDLHRQMLQQQSVLQQQHSQLSAQHYSSPQHAFPQHSSPQPSRPTKGVTFDTAARTANDMRYSL